MRLVILSDTHNQHDKLAVPDGDVFMHCGDFTMLGRPDEVIGFGDWVRSLPHKYKIVIAGNHDRCFEETPNIAREYLHANRPGEITYLQDSGIEIEGVMFWGSPWQPRFFDWAFNVDRGSDIMKKWALIPDNTDVLMTHGPPFGFLDHVPGTGPVGCEDLLERTLDLDLLVHAFGHIHEGSGIEQDGPTILVNASICDSLYNPTNPCRVVDIVTSGLE